MDFNSNKAKNHGILMEFKSIIKYQTSDGVLGTNNAK